MTDAVNCVNCGAPSQWRGPSRSGREQGWYRHLEPTRSGPRCHDRNACARRRSRQQMELFA